MILNNVLLVLFSNDANKYRTMQKEFVKTSLVHPKFPFVSSYSLVFERHATVKVCVAG